MDRKAKIIITSVIGFYYVVVIFFSRNFPLSDDFALLNFVTRIVNSPDMAENLRLLYIQHNEHRIITTKLVFLLDYWIFNGLNFKHLILIGNLFHLGTFYILLSHIPRKPGLHPYLCIVLACMIFQFGSAESTFWSMASISHYLLLFLFVLTLSLLMKDGLRFYLFAVITSVIAVFTQGNGILVMFIAAAQLAGRKRYRPAAFMLAAAAVTLAFYFYGYAPPSIHANPLESLKHIDQVLIFALSFTGSAFGLGGTHYAIITNCSLALSVITGFLIWAITGYAFYKKRYADGNIFIWLNTFIILSAVITALSRINFGLTQSMVSRYHIYSNLALISTLILSIRMLTDSQLAVLHLNRIFKSVTRAAIVYLILTFAVNYSYFGSLRSSGIIYPDKKQAMTILDRAEASGVFTAPP